ncbi:MAG: oligosaccharide flippase family protein [Gemmatimonadales bacterium]
MPASQQAPRVVRNVLSNWGTFAVFAVTNFFLSPFIVRQLGDSLYGIWAIIGSLVGYLGLLDLGVRGAVTRYMARYAALHEVGAANRLTSSALFLFTITSTAAVIGAAGFAGVAPYVLRIDPTHVGEARIALFLAGGVVATSLLAGVFGGILAGLHRWTQLNGLEVALEGLRVTAIVASLSRGGGIIALALIQLGIGALRLVVYPALARRAFPEVRLRLASVNWETIRMIASFGAYAMLLHASGMLIFASDTIVIGAMLPVSAVTFFVIGSNLIEYTRRIVSGISQPLTPLTSATDAVSEPEAVARLYRQSARLATLIVAPILVTFVLRGGTFIGLWMGESYRVTSGAVLAILAIVTFFGASQAMLVVTLLGLSRHRILLPLFIGEGIANLALSVALARPYGVVGVALGTMIPRLIVTMVFGPRIAQRQLGVPIARFARDAWLRPGLAMAGFAGGSFLVEQFWPTGSLMVFFAQVALIFPLGAAGAWYLAVEEDERVWVRRRIGYLTGWWRGATGEA